MSRTQRAAAAAAARRAANTAASSSSYRRRRGSVVQQSLRLFTGTCGFIRQGSLYSGFLHKWGEAADPDAWFASLLPASAPKRRFFVLRPTALLFYFADDTDDAVPLGVVDLELYARTETGTGGGGDSEQHRFTLSAPADADARRYELAAESANAKHKWIGQPVKILQSIFPD